MAPSKNPDGRSRQAKSASANALPSPHAFSYTIPDASAVGGPGKISLYAMDKRLEAEGKPGLLFRDAFRRSGRRPHVRELSSVKKEEIT